MPFTSKNNLNGKEVRVAWLMPSLARGHYWQPVFREFTKLFPSTLIFTGLWPGTLPACEGTFAVRQLHSFRSVIWKRTPTAYDTGFMWLPFSILWELLRFRPQIIFTSGFSLWSLYALPLKLFARCRIVLLWDGISPTTASLHSPIRLSIRRIMARFFDACLSNTQEGVDYLRDVLTVSDSKLRHHPYEVPDINLLFSCGNGENPLQSFAHPVFLFVGQLIQRKGVNNLLQACWLLKRRGMTCFSTVIVGDGPEGGALRRLADALGLNNQVHWVGRVEYAELGGYYRASDVFVFPSLEDIWGLVVPEAMAFGKAVLCSKYAGAKEMVLPGLNGFVFDPYKPQELAQFMARFIRQPDLIEILGAKSRQIIAPYTPELAADFLAATVSNVLDSTTQRASRI